MATAKPVVHLQEAERALEGEIFRLREELSKREDALAAVRMSIQAMRQRSGHPANRSQPSKRGSRRGLSKRAGHYDQITYRGGTFDSAGQLLDHLGVPHYFSKADGGKNDAEQRQILKWGRDNQLEAAEVMLVKRDGSRVSLPEFMKHEGWV